MFAQPFMAPDATLCEHIHRVHMHVSNFLWRSPINTKRLAICQCGVLGPQLPIPQFQLNLTSTSGEIPSIFAGVSNAFLCSWEMI